MRECGRIGPIEWAQAGRALPGEAVCGDRLLVVEAGPGALFAVVDGLGHGAPAADAAARAVEVLADHHTEPLDELMWMCHRALADTHGAAISLALMGFDGSLSWIGVGNVAATVVGAAPGGPRTRAWVLQCAGIVGYRITTAFEPRTVTMRAGDLLVMATDGVDDRFADTIGLARPAQEVADDILTGHATDTDDALVLVARHKGALR
ncbi:MAG TPA: SpoIIE family protein phosphatase [Aldersonia sp.]